MLLASLIYFLIQLTDLVLSEVGLLSAKKVSSSHEQYFCVSYVSPTLKLPETKTEAKSTPLLDLSSWDACYSHWNSTIANAIENSTIIVNSLDCMLVQKGNVIQNSGGVGLLASVPALTYDMSLPNSTDVLNVKIPLGLITTGDELKLKKMGSDVMVQLYVPQKEKFYFNFSLLIIWLIAMISVSLGGTYKHLRINMYKLICNDKVSDSNTTGNVPTRLTHNDHTTSKSVCDDDTEDDLNNVSSSETSINHLLNPVNDGQPNALNGDQVSSSKQASSVSKRTYRYFWIAVNVVVFITVVILTYFFFGSLVYFFIGTYVILSALSVYWLLMPIVHLLAYKFSRNGCSYNLRWPCRATGSQTIDVPQVILFLLSSACAISWCVFRHEKSIWILHNLLSMAISITVISYQKITKLKVCTMILIIFFVYDIFLVFVTPLFTTDGKSVMEKLVLGEDDTRSTKQDEEMPTVLKVPYFTSNPVGKCWDMYFILGLGDIIIPGLLFLLCYDFGEKIGTQKFYFPAVLVGYGVGLILTDVFLSITMMGQPALLYLVPCSLSCVITVAIVRKELAWLWHGQPQAVQNGKTYYEAPCSEQDVKEEC